MNKVQYIELLKLRGITGLSGKSIATAIKDSGGAATTEEMVKVNEAAMAYYLDKSMNLEKMVKSLTSKNESLAYKVTELSKRDDFLLALEGAGVDNWSGYEDAMDSLNE